MSGFASLISVAAILVVARADNDIFVGKINCTTPVSYRLTFVSRWTPKRHPPGYPRTAHWSGPVYAVHNSDYVMWSPEITATPGVQNVAETGGQRPLLTELEENDGVMQFEAGRPMFNLDRNFEQEIGVLNVNHNYSYVSGIAMIAPSPDWFAGIRNFNLCSEDGTWIEYAEIDGPPYDGGTDDGEGYASPDSPNPPVNIFRLNLETIPNSTNVFISEKDGQPRVLPVAMTVLRRIKGPEENCSATEEFRFKEEPNRDCAWVGRVRSRNSERWMRLCARVDRVRGVRNLVKNFCPEQCDNCPT